MRISIDFNDRILWTTGKILPYQKAQQKIVPPEMLTRITKNEAPQNKKLFLTKVETLPQPECKYAVTIDLAKNQIENSKQF